MADSKIVRQLRFTSGSAVPGSTDTIRSYGSGRHVDAAVTPGAPEGPTAASKGAAAATAAPRIASPNPSNGLTRRPGQINVTPGIGEDSVKIRRAQAPSAIAMSVNPAAGAPQGPTAAFGNVPRGVSPVVLAQGLTSEQASLLDMLLDDFIGTHTPVDGGDKGNPELAALARETKVALARIPVTQNQTAADVATAPARPRRVEHAQSPGGFNPPGEVKIFAPNTQPFETTNGRQQ